MDAKAAKREARYARAAAAAAALGKLKRGRLWYASLEVTRELVVLRLQGDRAEVHFEERAASLVVIGWWGRVERRRRITRAEDVAEDARVRRYAFGGLEAWVRYVVARRGKGRTKAAAGRHRRGALVRRGFDAWRVWLDGHNARRDRLEGALEMHRLR